LSPYGKILLMHYAHDLVFQQRSLATTNPMIFFFKVVFELAHYMHNTQ